MDLGSVRWRRVPDDWQVFPSVACIPALAGLGDGVKPSRGRTDDETGRGREEELTLRDGPLLIPQLYLSFAVREMTYRKEGEAVHSETGIMTCHKTLGMVTQLT